MHRLPQAARLTAVIVGLLAALLAPAVAEARAPTDGSPQPAESRPWTAGAAELARTAPQAIKYGTTNKRCTGWRSDYQPPPTIQVLRTHGPDTGHVESVDFPTYVAWVLSAEWTAYYPLEAMKVGAIAVKQYGWYYTIVYRGGVDADGNCYDVTDNTTDQYYDPDATPPRALPGTIHYQAMAATWNISLRKFSQATGTSRLFVTGYRAGKNVPCGQQRDGYRLYQHSILRCASPLDPRHPEFPHDLNYEQILRIYLNPHLEVVDPGANNVIGTSQGDVTTLTGLSATALAPRIYQQANLRGISPAATSAISVASDGLIGSASADMNGDGRDDLVTLTATGTTSARVDVAMSDGTADYTAPTTWWPGTDLGEPVGEAQLMVGDFNADGRTDVGILIPAPDLPPSPASSDPQAQLIVVLQRKTGVPAAPAVWWTGSLNIDPARSRAWAADLNGDGATDLLVAQDVSVPDTTPTGVHFVAALSAPPAAGLAPLATWFDAPDLLLSGMLGTIGDINRDGLDDLFVAYPASDGRTHIDVIKGSLRLVKRAPMWTATAADPMPVGKLKLESADLNFDGQSDLVLYRDRAEQGTTLLVLRGTYRKLKAYDLLTDPTLDWSTTTPY